MQCSGACPRKTRPPSCSTSTSVLGVLLICLDGGLPLRGCVCAGASCCESRYERGEGVLKGTKGASKRATVMRARGPTVDLAALKSETCCLQKRNGISKGLRASRRKLCQLPRLLSPLVPMPSAPPQGSGLGRAGGLVQKKGRRHWRH